MNLTQHRTQLLLDHDRYQWLNMTAARTGKSIAQVVRELVDQKRKAQQKEQHSKKQQAYRDLLKLAGIGKRGPADVSEKHDKYLGDWLYEEMRGKKR